MALIWYEYALIAAIFAGILVTFAGMTFGFLRLRVQKWVGGAIGNFMANLAKNAAEEEGQASSTSPPGALSLGGIPIGAIIQAISDPNVQKLIGKFLTPGGGGGSGW